MDWTNTDSTWPTLSALALRSAALAVGPKNRSTWSEKSPTAKALIWATSESMLEPLKLVSAVRNAVAVLTCCARSASTLLPFRPAACRHRMKNRTAAPSTTRNRAHDTAWRADAVRRRFTLGSFITRNAMPSGPRAQLGSIGQPYGSGLAGRPHARPVDRVTGVPLEDVGGRGMLGIRASRRLLGRGGTDAAPGVRGHPAGLDRGDHAV